MPFVDFKGVAQEIGVSPFTVRAWVRTRYIPFLKAGRLVRFDLEEVRAWLRQRSSPGRVEQTPKIETS